MTKPRQHVPLRRPATGRTVMSEVVAPPELVHPDYSKYEPEFEALDFWEIAPTRTKFVVERPDTDREPHLPHEPSETLHQELAWLLWFCCQNTESKIEHDKKARTLGALLLKQLGHHTTRQPSLPYRCGTMLSTASPQEIGRMLEAWSDQDNLWCCWYGAYGDWPNKRQAAIAWNCAISNLGQQGHHYQTTETSETSTILSVVEDHVKADEFNNIVKQVIGRLAKTNPRPKSRRGLGFHPHTVPWPAITRKQFEERFSEPIRGSLPRSNEQAYALLK